MGARCSVCPRYTEQTTGLGGMDAQAAPGGATDLGRVGAQAAPGGATDLGGVRAQAALRGEALAADLAVEWPVLHALDLRVVVPQVLLQVRQLDEGPAALGVVTLVRTFS